jgi:3-oxoacyl-[acyl-carrier protein] reductase
MVAEDRAARAAIVTGGTKGIGRAIAEALAATGVRVAIGARTEADVRSVADALGGEGRALGVVCDVSRAADCARLVERTVETFGRLDILVNNAGLGRFGTVDDITVEDWRLVLGTNLDGAFYSSRSAIPHMRRGGGGWIINIGSLAGKNPFAGGAAYNASKFGLLGFSEAMMLDVRHDGIRVSCIMPGSVATEFRGPREPAAWKPLPEDIAQIVMDLLAMPGRTLPSRVEVRPTRPPKK